VNQSHCQAHSQEVFNSEGTDIQFSTYVHKHTQDKVLNEAEGNPNFLASNNTTRGKTTINETVSHLS
jgi:hypothetical protein